MGSFRIGGGGGGLGLCVGLGAEAGGGVEGEAAGGEDLAGVEGLLDLLGGEAAGDVRVAEPVAGEAGGQRGPLGGGFGPFLGVLGGDLVGVGLGLGGVVAGDGHLGVAGGLVGVVGVAGVGVVLGGFLFFQGVELLEEAEEGVVHGALVAVQEEEGVVGVLGEEGVRNGLAGGLVGVGEEVLLGVGEAAEAPEEVRDQGEQVVLEDRAGAEFALQFVEEHAEVGVDVLVGGVGAAGGDGLGEAVGGRVARGAGLALGGLGAGGALGVAAVGLLLLGADRVAAALRRLRARSSQQAGSGRLLGRQGDDGHVEPPVLDDPIRPNLGPW
jgi:hypothetical protein